MAEDFLNNCDPPILPSDPDLGGGGSDSSGGSGGSGGGSGSRGGGGGQGGGRTPTTPQPTESSPPSRSGAGGAGGGAGGGGAGGGGAGGGGAGTAVGISVNCNPFSGPTLPTNKGKGWSETPTQYAKIKGKDIEPRKINCDCEGSDGSGSKEEQRFKDVTIYPYNKVTETESGHVVEFDDTPGSERISTNHRSGTFEEYHPNGDKVVKVVRDLYTSVLRNNHMHIDGYCDVTIDKALKILVNTDQLKNSEEEAVNFDIHIGKNANINIYIEKGQLNVLMDDGDSNIQLKKGDINIRQDDGNYNHFINGDYNIECTGHMHVVVGEDQVTEIGGNRDVRVDGDFDNLNMTKEGSVQETTLAGNRRTKIDQDLTEHVGKITEKDYGDVVREIYRQGAERTYSGADTMEQHKSWSVNVGPIVTKSEAGTSLREGDFSLHTLRSVSRAEEENYIICLEGTAGIRSYSHLFLEAGIGENGKNKAAVLRMYSENEYMMGAKKKITLYSFDDINISTRKNLWLFAGGTLYKNDEFEDGGIFKGEAAPTLLSTDVKRPIDPFLPIPFVYAEPGKWVPTNKK
jgi:hypothetical protein